MRTTGEKNGFTAIAHAWVSVARAKMTSAAIFIGPGTASDAWSLPTSRAAAVSVKRNRNPLAKRAPASRFASAGRKRSSTRSGSETSIVVSSKPEKANT
jgi:hypothetical protein